MSAPTLSESIFPSASSAINAPPAAPSGRGQRETLALFGGKPTIETPFNPYNGIGAEEKRAVQAVMDSGCLSGFYGSWCPEFYGGPTVRALEAAWSERFHIRHSITVNSNTSGLLAALGAIGLSPGDEVIVPPCTMSATVVAPLFYGGIPVFADVEPETFCLDVTSVQRAITPRTRAILAVNLFGHPAELALLRSLADEHGIYLIEDNAQAPLALEHGRLAGTVGHIGVFSLNYHKHIHTGEGGVCVTDDDELALRLQLIRNHGENLVEPMGLGNIANLVGLNLRMTELCAAIGLEQLRKIDDHVGRRVHLAERLTAGLNDLPGLTPPAVRPGCAHVYYGWAARYDESVVGIGRKRFSEALAAEGFPHGCGYVRPLYYLPVFQRRMAIGGQGYPFTLSDNAHYEAGLCPAAEQLHTRELLTFEPCAYDVEENGIDLLIEAVRKVYRLRERLADAPPLHEPLTQEKGLCS